MSQPEPDRETVLVFGSTGTQGRPVAGLLLEEGYAVRAVTRNPEAAAGLTARGAQVVAADLNDPDAVRAAAQGADRVFLHLPLSFGAPGAAERARAAIDALVAAGVRQIVFSTSGPVPDAPQGIPGLDDRVAVLRHVLDTGVGTVLKPTGFMENFAAPWSAERLAAGELAYPRPPELQVAWVTNDDVAAAALAAMRDPATVGQVFVLAGPEALDGPAAADRLARGLGRPVTYREIDGTEFAEMMTPYLGAETAKAIGSGYDQMPRFQDPMMIPDGGPAAAALGIRLTPLEEWARTRDWDAGGRPRSA